LHQNAMIGGSNQLLESQRLLARQKADIRHANHGQTIPTFGAQRSARAILSDGVRGLARTEISREQSVRDDRLALRGNAFIIEAKRSEPWSVLLARVRDHVYHLTSVAQRAQLVECQKRRTGEVRFHPQHAIEFNGMPNRFVNLQSKL